MDNFAQVLTTPGNVTIITNNGESCTFTSDIARKLGDILPRKADMAEIIGWDDPIDAEKVDESHDNPVMPDEVLASLARIARKVRFDWFEFLGKAWKI